MVPGSSVMKTKVFLVGIACNATCLALHPAFIKPSTVWYRPRCYGRVLYWSRAIDPIVRKICSDNSS